MQWGFESFSGCHTAREGRFIHKNICYTLGADGVNLSASAKAPYSCETWLYFGASGCAPSYRWKHLKTKRRDAPDSFFMDYV